MRERIETLEMENERLRAENRRLSSELAGGEQRFANEQVRELRRTGYCPCCGAEERSQGRWS